MSVDDDDDDDDDIDREECDEVKSARLQLLWNASPYN